MIYSRAVHDFHYCRCTETSIDGGFEYIKCGGMVEHDTPSTVKIYIKYINATRTELYADWYCDLDKYGIIKKEIK